MALLDAVVWISAVGDQQLLASLVQGKERTIWWERRNGGNRNLFILSMKYGYDSGHS